MILIFRGPALNSQGGIPRWFSSCAGPAATWRQRGWVGRVATIGTLLRAEVPYACADHGVTIAYSVVGDGPVTIVVVSPLISQLELAWEEPAMEHFWSRFAACARVVLSGRRRAGLPDRSATGERLDLAALALDVEAVLDACDTGAAVLSGMTFGCPVAVQLRPATRIAPRPWSWRAGSRR